MTDIPLMQVNAAMRTLVSMCGGVDAAAQQIAERSGTGPQKGTVSKKMNGQYDWTVADVLALEDGMGRYPVSKILAARLPSEDSATAMDLMNGLAAAAKESGEAQAALLKAIASGKPDDMAKAAVEWREAVAAFQQMMPAFDADTTSAPIPFRGGVR